MVCWAVVPLRSLVGPWFRSAEGTGTESRKKTYLGYKCEGLRLCCMTLGLPTGISGQRNVLIDRVSAGTWRERSSQCLLRRVVGCDASKC